MKDQPQFSINLTESRHPGTAL